MTSISLSPIPVLFILNLALVSKLKMFFFKKKIVGFFGQFFDVAKVVIMIQRKILPNLATS
jgi:hypothetical protein